MAQHDYNIANQSGADFRADLNNALLAIATTNSGASEPSTTFAHQLWVDTSSSVLKIRNAADNAWITTGISITASNTFTGDLTGNVTGNITGNVTGNVTGDLTGNADTATTLATARTISLSGDVVGSASFDGSGDINISTTAQINSIALGTDTTGDYVQSISGGTGVTITGGTGEGSTPSVAIGQPVATTDNVTFNLVTATDEFIGDIDGAVRFSAKADEALTKGDVIYITGVSGNTPTIAKAKADDASKMPAFGIALQTVNANATLQIVTLGTIESLDTSNESVGEILYVSTTAGEYTTTIPTGETSQIQNIGKVLRSHATVGSIRVGGAGRSNATPNLNNGKIFIGNASNQSVTATLDTSIVVENTNLYYTTTRANTDFDTRLATKDTGDLTEGANLYYTTARVNSDFDTRLATKSTTNLAEGTNLYYTTARFDSAFTSKDTDDLSEGTTNLYYTTARFDSAFGNKTTADLTENTNLYYTDTRANSAIDARVTKAFVDALNIQAASVDANSVTLGTDTTGNYVATVTGTANKITVSGSGSESADITLTLPDDVQIADSLTVAGNLTVNGTLTSLDTTNLDIEDNLFQLNAGLTGSPVNDSGMLINRGTADNGIFMWDESVDKFTLGLTTADGSATGNITLNSLGTLVANLEGNVTGNVTGQVSDISNFTTANLTENTNLYYTQARFDSAFTAKSTSDLSEGTNLYYTDARFDTRLASKDTDDVSEGTSNLYYTSARFDSAFGGKSTSDLSEGTNLYYTDARAQAVSINNVVEDTTPQLGGDLDLNSSDITGTGNINITGTIQSSGNITGTLATAAQPNITSVGTLTGLTTTGNINLGDNDIVIFGASSDLQIYHDGTNSSIQNSTGDLFIYGGTDDIRIRAKNDEESIVATPNGAVTLYHDNSPKLATTSTGIDVTGTATMDGLTVDTSTLVVDATNNRVGIGTSSPSQKLHIVGGGILVDNGSSAGTIYFHDTTNYINLSSDELQFANNGAERMRIDSSGTVLFKSGSFPTNQDSPFIYRIGGGSLAIGAATETGTSAHAAFYTNSLERMRIDSSGNLLVSKTSTSITNTGTTFESGGRFFTTANGQEAAILNRQTSDGDILQFRKDNTTTVGSISTINSTLVIGSGDTGLLFSSGDDVIVPRNSSTAVRDAAIDLGDSGNRFKDLYLSSKTRYQASGGNQHSVGVDANDLIIRSETAGSETARFTYGGNLLVGKTSTAFGTAGAALYASGDNDFVNDGNVMSLNRLSSDGSIVTFYKNSSAVGSIAAKDGDIALGTGDTALRFLDGSDAITPHNISTNAGRDNAIDLGSLGARFDDIYATNGTIQTSDRNEKQDIEALTDAETRVAVAAKGLLRKFRWKDAVAEKGDEARTHFGIIAQDLQDAFTAEGLDAGDYAMFISSTWTDDDGIEQTRLGVRYSELLAFIIAAI
mgnify:CR=1 FL=1